MLTSWRKNGCAGIQGDEVLWTDAQSHIGENIGHRHTCADHRTQKNAQVGSCPALDPAGESHRARDFATRKTCPTISLALVRSFLPGVVVIHRSGLNRLQLGKLLW
jgi:hypothetical protein